MDYLRPSSWDDAIALKTEDPAALPICGGTDVMVEVNFDRVRPGALLDLSHLEEIQGWEIAGDNVRLGAGVTFAEIIGSLADELPGLAKAARTVGSPQIRNRGTIGGNLGSASPAGDAHPPLLATGATVEAESLRGTREIPIAEFFTGVKRTSLQQDELIRSVVVPRATGPQEFSKVGARNAMVIAVASFAIALNGRDRKVGTGIGSAAPTPVSAAAAEEFLEEELTRGGHWEQRTALSPQVLGRFGDLVAGAADPIDDVRGTAKYRRHALDVMAQRALGWSWTAFQGEPVNAG
ncbi:MAG: FAD binding domain-containing protein [Acidimicrobiia bacterium]